MLDFKKAPLGTALFFIALILILIGTGINFKNEMFGDNTTSGSDDGGTATEESKLPTDMKEVSEKLNEDMGKFLLYKYDSLKDSGIDLLASPAKRLDLVKLVLEQENKAEENTGKVKFLYVKEEDFKEKYVEIFGGDEQYEDDLKNAYTVKNTVEQELGEGYIGWNPNWGTIAIERELNADSVEYDDTNELYTITGTYKDSSLGSETATGTFTITYGEKDGSNYIVSVILTEDV